MIKHPRIELDASRLLGFKQVKGTQPGHLSGQQAEVGPIAAPTPEPSTWAEFLMGLLVLGVFAIRSHYQKKKARAAVIAGSQTEASATAALSDKD